MAKDPKEPKNGSLTDQSDEQERDREAGSSAGEATSGTPEAVEPLSRAQKARNILGQFPQGNLARSPKRAEPITEPINVHDLQAALAKIQEAMGLHKPGSFSSKDWRLPKTLNLDADLLGKNKRVQGDSVGVDDKQASAVVEETVRAKPNRDAKYISNLIDKCKEKDLCGVVKQEVLDILSENPIISEYEVIFLYDNNQIAKHHASAIYQRLSAIDGKKDIFLILRSPGGEVESAYLISKMCNRYKLNKFVVGIPADAKSAATLLSLGADELHMGAMSELGPIDPQINDYPALAFSGALECITKLADEYPGAANMLSQYLIGSSLDVRALGHYERITESATQYALRLLKSKVTSTDFDLEKAKTLAGHFTNHYKDHNFVIDMDEACELFGQLGGDIVKADTELYKACHEVHRFIDLFHQVCAIKDLNKRLVIIGDNFIL